MNLYYWDDYVCIRLKLWSDSLFRPTPLRDCGKWDGRWMTAAAVHIKTLPYTNLKPHIKLRKTWQRYWSEQTGNKLRIVKPHLGRYTTDSHNIHAEVALARLRIGLTRVTHSYLFTGPSRRLCGGPICSPHPNHVQGTRSNTTQTLSPTLQTPHSTPPSLLFRGNAMF